MSCILQKFLVLYACCANEADFYSINQTIRNRMKEVLTMAKCSVCGKSVHFGNKVSHSHRRSNKMWKPNIKSVRVKVNGGTKKMPVCTGCLRSGAVERA